MIARYKKSMLNAYYNYRYWQNIIQSMKYNLKDINSQHNKTCTYLNKPGIAFSFDDNFRIHHWLQYGKGLFGYYDVKVTFNINAFHHFENERSFTQEEIDMLLDLQSNGHEIAHHGFKHKRATDFVEMFGMEKWISEEILTLFEWMEEQTHSLTKEKLKKPATFAFPYFKSNKECVNALVPKYFKVVRGHLDKQNLIPFNYTGFTPSICIDVKFLKSIKMLKKILKFLKEFNKNLILTCHSILPDEQNWDDFGWGKESKPAGQWRISPKLLGEIIEIAKENGLAFYTTSELAGIASFIDRNLESYIRYTFASSRKWIMIEDLENVTQLDLSNKNITNLDGLQYFSNLESINLIGNNINDYRLLKKIPKLRKILQ
ncbi:DUF2334 domain-containing protein [Fictibacillus fluitans]|uniref:Polysaccharide deacetylase n=1 Tax=Fictibacillus fluitans TaxID=3058422 RepID=A0ABT8I0Z5_9BACL|nr:polysaccharide deacetylase family protein [Fictibacillus sp. NE201]MDN4526717.1 polysaccharide deacetylase [Fictibacillus sp. NE201]